MTGKASSLAKFSLTFVLLSSLLTSLAVSVPIGEAQKVGGVNVDIGTDSVEYDVGEPVTVQVRVRATFPLDSPPMIRLRFNTPTGPFEVDAGSGGSDWVAYTVTEVTSTPGYYSVVAEAIIGEGRYYSGRALFRVVPQFDFGVAISPSTQTVSITERASYSVTVNLVSGHTEPVFLSLSGLPDGLSYGFSPKAGSPTFTSTLTIDAHTGSPLGSFTFTVAASVGGLSRTTTAALTVHEAADFTVSVSPHQASLSQGGSTTFYIDVNPVGDFDKVVTLTVSGLPSGASPAFTVPSGKPPFSSTLTITASPNTPEGSYTPSIDATGRDRIHTGKISLIIEKTKKQSSLLSISASAHEGKVTVAGVLTPAVAQARITLDYKSPDGTTITREQVTRTDGGFTDTYSPSPTGAWTVTASWPGNDKYGATTSQPVTFTVQKPTSDALNTTYLLLVAVIILAAAVILALTRKRK